MDKLRTIGLLLAMLAGAGICFGQKASLDIEKAAAQAEEHGIREAKKDFTNGVYVLETYGLGAEWSTERSKYLKEKYNVTSKCVAGCVVTPQIVGHARGYNNTMKAFLNKKFDRDVYKEAEDFAKQKIQHE